MREPEQVSEEYDDAFPPYTPTASELEDAHRAHLASVERELTKTRDLLLDDDKALAFWKRYRGEA